MNHYYHTIFGWFDYEEIYNHAVSVLPENSRIVELGCWKGKSSSFLLVEAKNSNKFFDIHLCDTFEGSEEHYDENSVHYAEDIDKVFDQFKHNVEQANYPYVVHRMDSLELSSKFDNDSIDFLFIDTDHSYEHVSKELKAWYPKVKKGGIIAGHDYNSAGGGGVVEAVDEFFYEELTLVQGSITTSWFVIKQFEFPANCLANQPKQEVKYAQVGLDDEYAIALLN
jgi:hypothetical protein